ncbi:hypothetical protein ACTFIU_011358 [Dictyostelium citrinum]
MISFNLILILFIFLIFIPNYIIGENDVNLIKCPHDLPYLKKWSDKKSWNTLKLPKKGESINITTPILMDIKPPDLGVIRIFNKGMLVWKHINGFELRVKAILVYDGGQLIIGSEQCKFKYKATITLIGDSIYTEANQTINSNEYGQKVIGIDSGGTIELHSEVTKITWSKLKSTISPPSTFKSKNKYNIITLLDDVNDWPIGSEILITSTDYDMEQSETNIIDKCTTCKPNQIKLKNPIKYVHWGSITRGVDERAEVALLTRNIKIQGQLGRSCKNSKLVCDFFPFDSFGAHIMIQKGFVNAHFFGVELYNVGQSHMVSRYPIHFHLCERVDQLGGYEKPAYIKHCSVHKSFSRCYVVHGTDGLLIHDNIGFDSIGHCFMLCDGIEMDNTFSHNLGAVTRHGLLFPHDRSCDMCIRIQPKDYNGNPTQCTECNAVSTFWISNPSNTFIDNVAAGSASTGIWYLFSDYPSGLSYQRGVKEKIKPYLLPVKKFYNNIIHSCTNGLQIDGGVKLTKPSKKEPQQLNSMISARYKPRSNPKDPNSKPSPSIFNGATIYKNKWRGCWARGGFLFMKNFKIADNAIGFTFASEGTIPGDPNVGQQIYKSLIVGESDNIGQQSNNIPIVNGRTNPYGENGLMPIRGFEIYDGTISLDSIVFSSFKSLSLPSSSSSTVRNSSAIGFLRFNDWQSSTETTLKNIKYLDVDREIHFEQSLMDGDKISTLRDLDGSTTKLSNSILVRNLLFYSTKNCNYKKQWDALICKEETRQIYICNDDTDSTNYLLPNHQSTVVAIRDGIENQRLEQNGLPNHSPRNRFQFLVFKDHHYDFHFPNHPTPPILRVQPMNWKQSEKLTFGVCIGASKGINLTVLKTVNGTYGNTDHVQELYPTISMNLISESTYYFDEITSILYIMYYQYNSKGHFSYCPEYGCEELVIKISGINSGRVTGDCQSLAYGSSFTLFDEVVNRKFENSFQMDKSIIYNSEYAYRGNAYLPYHPTSKSQIQFKCNNCIPSVGIKYLEIWVNGNRYSNQRISIQLFYSIDLNQFKSQPFPIDGNYFKKNSWVLVRILFEKLRNLLPENHIKLISSFDGLSIINSLASNQPILFLDNIKLIYDN